MILRLELSIKDSANLERIANALSKLAEIPTISKDYKTTPTIEVSSPDYEAERIAEEQATFEEAAKLLDQSDNNNFFEEDGLPVEILERL